MPFTPDQPTPGFKADAPTQGFKPDNAEPSIHDVAQSLMPKNFGVPAAYKQVTTPQGTQQLGTLLVPGSQQALTNGIGALGRIGVGGLAGGATAVGTANPELSQEDKLSLFLKGFGVGTIASGAGEVGNKMSDNLMKVATGIRKAPEGVGNTLAKQGLWGTQERMLNQVEQKLPEEERSLQELVSGFNGDIDQTPIAEAILEKGKKFVSPSGITLDSVKPDLNKVTEAAGQFDPQLIGRQGPVAKVTPGDLLSLKRQGDWAGYTASGNPAAATDAEIGRAVANKARGMLNDMSGGETANILKREQALLLAKKAMDKDPTTHLSIGGKLLFSKIPSIIGSTAGQLFDKASNTLNSERIQRALTQKLFDEQQ